MVFTMLILWLLVISKCKSTRNKKNLVKDMNFYTYFLLFFQVHFSNDENHNKLYIRGKSFPMSKKRFLYIISSSIIMCFFIGH